MKYNLQTDTFPWLDEHAIEYIRYDHEEITDNETDYRIMKEYNMVGAPSKTIAFKTKSGRFILVATTLERRVDKKVVKEYAGERVNFANFDELTEYVVCDPHTIPTICMPEVFEIIIDPNIFVADGYLFSPGISTITISLNRDNLRKALDAMPNKMTELEDVAYDMEVEEI
ncbi:YbaK/EbsC family protein [Culicoidibacter larvae]|uniref:YbaK/EbsC family protein n=1 Tax=Culicoidibacter larvae TaxID=2579976 RepID=A0A5R8QFK7_9FIRM|nr:YbaK/EbsC family protein [Culicoidibacter larvae]TLG76795.1 YbaK/EbsC family protein [Culicoidibacter larvae]